LVHVERVGQAFVLDAIELPDCPEEPGRLMSFTFEAPKLRFAASRERRRLARWVTRQDGLCSAHSVVDRAITAVILVQGDKRISIATELGTG
jgi:hypothetical protein